MTESRARWQYASTEASAVKLVLLHFLRAELSASGVHFHQKKRVDTIHILDTCPLLEVSGNSCISSLWGNGVLILIRKKKKDWTMPPERGFARGLTGIAGNNIGSF